MVSDEDYERLSRFNWYCGNGYAYRKATIDGVRRNIFMHREVMNVGLFMGYGVKERAIVVDHINANKLDNQIGNLRVCTHRENMMNRKRPINNTSGIKGISVCLQTGAWLAKLYYTSDSGKRRYTGRRFKEKENAKKWLDKKRIELNGLFARFE